MFVLHLTRHQAARVDGLALAKEIRVGAAGGLLGREKLQGGAARTRGEADADPRLCQEAWGWQLNGQGAAEGLMTRPQAELQRLLLLLPLLVEQADAVDGQVASVERQARHACSCSCCC